MKICIIGGGGSVAVTTRILTEKLSGVEVDVFTKREVAGYRPCELTYVLGNKIPDFNSIITFNAKAMEAKGVKYHFATSALKINREEKWILTSDGKYDYDKLIIASGATPFLPNIPGVNGSKVFILGTDMNYAKKLAEMIPQFKSALILGAGAIGLEVAEVLKEKGYNRVIVADIADRLLVKSLDEEMSMLLLEKLKTAGIEFCFSKMVEKIEDSGTKKKVFFADEEIEVDMVVVSVGFKPNTELAVDCGLEIGSSGAIKVNQHMLTSDKDIYAIGDVAEGWDIISKKPCLSMKADNAVRTAKIAARHLAGDVNATFLGSVNGLIIYLQGLFVGAVGYPEDLAKDISGDKVKTVVHEGMTLPKYLGGNPIKIKLVYDSEKGILLGAQIVSKANIAGELDKLALAITEKISIEKLRGTEVLYTPASGWPYGPVTQALDKCDV